MAKSDNIKKRFNDPKYLESIRNRFMRLYNELGNDVADNTIKVIKFNALAWNGLGTSARFQFNTKIEIH